MFTSHWGKGTPRVAVVEQLKQRGKGKETNTFPHKDTDWSFSLQLNVTF